MMGLRKRSARSGVIARTAPFVRRARSRRRVVTRKSLTKVDRRAGKSLSVGPSGRVQLAMPQCDHRILTPMIATAAAVYNIRVHGDSRSSTVRVTPRLISRNRVDDPITQFEANRGDSMTRDRDSNGVLETGLQDKIKSRAESQQRLVTSGLTARLLA